MKSWLSATRRAFAFARRSPARSRSLETIRRTRSISATPTASRCATRLSAFGGDPERARVSSRARASPPSSRRISSRVRCSRRRGCRLAIVTAINGATRLEVGVDGVAGHAGATPMSLRRDALTAAAEMALAIEERARREPDLVATVGRLEAWPGRDQRHSRPCAVFHRHTRPGGRAPGDGDRRHRGAHRTPSPRRGASARASSRRMRRTPSLAIAEIIAGLKEAVEAVGVPPRLLPSGAGHDTMAMGGLCPAGMLFVRCKGGVSHNPLESITVEDCAIGLEGAHPIHPRFSRRLEFRVARF